MENNSKFVSIENDNGEINICFWADNAKSDLEEFKVCKTPEEAEASVNHWVSQGKTLISAQ